MTTLALQIDGLGKRYAVSRNRERSPYRTLRESLVEWARNPFARRQDVEEFWALQDVSFDVQPGEVVGVIGRNGAGKSTLLKILSRITRPTTGRVEIHGRVGSLLEVGTGFHPELSGRENIFLNGGILGMSRREIQSKFDEIVAFAEVERFLDTPVKRFSSGMYVRLAFAVAAHLEPEILIIDEVLAVGDAAFQKKCLGKMREVSRHGRTVLFVSHNMTAVSALCSRVVVLSGGGLRTDDSTERAIAYYMGEGGSNTWTAASQVVSRGKGTGKPTMAKATLKNSQGDDTSRIAVGAGLRILVSFFAGNEPVSPVLGVVFNDPFGRPLFGNNNRVVPGFHFAECTGAREIEVSFPVVPLLPGTYSIDLYLGDQYVDHDVALGALELTVDESDFFGSGKLPPPGAGPIAVAGTWSLAERESQ